MEVKYTAQLLTVKSTPWEMGGREGVSHKARLNVDGEIYQANLTEGQVEQLKSLEGKSGVAEFKFSSQKENLKLHLVSFKEE